MVQALDEDPAGPAGGATAPAMSAVDRGRTLFARMGCGTCHSLASANAVGQIGPDLDKALEAYDAEALRAKIVDPGRTSVEEMPVMPGDFGERMNTRELSELVAFLLASRGATASPSAE